VSAHPELLISDKPNPSELVYNCTVDVLPTALAHTVLRTCTRSTVDTCPEDWTDEEVRAQCEAYIAQVCLGDTVYRNDYCGICNNNGSFQGLPCSTYNNSVESEDTSFDSKHDNTWFYNDLGGISFDSDHENASFYNDLEGISFDSEHENNWFHDDLESTSLETENDTVVVGVTQVYQVRPPDFRVLVQFQRTTKTGKCQQDKEEYDLFNNTCRSAFLEPERKCKFSSFDLTLNVCFVH
jgi:hypothetical protein